MVITAMTALVCEKSYAKAITSYSQLNDHAVTLGTDGTSPLHYYSLKDFPDAK